jgi:hypothetical protein
MRARWLLSFAPCIAAECPEERSDPEDPIVVEACPEGLFPSTNASGMVNELVVNGVSTVVELLPTRRYAGLAAVCADPELTNVQILLEASGDAFATIRQTTVNSGNLDANGDVDFLSIEIGGDTPMSIANGDWQNVSWLVERNDGGLQIDLTGAALVGEDQMTIQALFEVYP